MIEQTLLAGVHIVTPKRFSDDRGFFSETWNRRALVDAGIDIDFVQDNHSLSRQAGTLRGLHFQTPPHAQAKLVRVVRGAVFDVAVDYRVGSPTYLQWVGVELTAENGKQLLVPEGFLHGFLTLADDTEVLYKCSDYYAPDCDRSVLFDDPDIGIDWGADITVLSDKDANASLVANTPSPFTYG